MKTVRGTSIILKEVNRNLVWEALKTERRATCRCLAEKTGLTTVTIQSILADMLRDDDAFQIGYATSNGGRPAAQYEFNAQKKLVACLYYFETKEVQQMQIRVVDLFGTILKCEELPIKNPLQADLAEVVRGLCEKNTRISAAAISLPGYEIADSFRCDIRSLNGRSISQFLTKTCALPVIFENDVNVAALGYCQRNQLCNAEALLYFYLPCEDLPGIAICFNGQIYRGFRNYAGEIRENYFNIPWNDRTFQENQGVFCQMIAATLVRICCILSPFRVVLAGGALKESYLEQIRKVFLNIYDLDAAPQLTLTDSFEQDMEAGIVSAALSQLEPKLFINQR